MAELKTPIFGKNGMFNREGRRVRAVHVLDVEDGGGVLRLYRYDGEPDNSTPHGEGDAYYLHVEAAGYLIPIGYTLHQLAERLGRPEAVRELYGSEEARRERLEAIRDEAGADAYQRMRPLFEAEDRRAQEIGREPARLAAAIRQTMEAHRATFVQALDNGGETWPDYIGAALCGKLDAVPALRARYDELRAQRDREELARREAEAAARMAAQDQEAREALELAAQTIRQGGTLENDEITDGNGTARAVVLRLMDVYGVAVPPRTRAWMRDKLAAVTFAPGGRVSGLQYRRMRGGRCSGAVWDYLAQLVEAVRGKSGEGAA